MTTTLPFTDEYYPDSTAVDEAFYNENDGTLFVDLHNTIYAYPGVPKDVWEQFKDAPSAGRFYAENIKRQYGPSTTIGTPREVEYRPVEVGPRRAAVGAPQALTVTTANPVEVSTAAPVTHLSMRSNAPVGNNGRTFEVVFKDATGAYRKHTVKNVAGFAEAEAAVLDIAAMLDVTFDVRSVTVID